MTMTDMLLQMTLQNTWQMTQATQNAGQTANNSQTQTGTSFQDLLNQRRDDLTQTGDKTTDGKDVKDDATAGTTGKTDQEPQEGVLEAAVAAAAPMALSDLTAVPANFVEQTGSAESPVVQTVTVEAVVPDVQTAAQLTTAAQTQAMPQTQVQTQAQQEVPQAQTTVQQPQTTAADVQSAQAAVPQGNETVVQTPAAQSGAQENLTEDLGQAQTQSAAPQTQSDELQDVTVESFQTPLFQNVEATPVQVGEGETVDMTAPAQQVDQSLGDMLKTALDDGAQHLEIKLSPANLGTVTAEFTRTPEGVLHVVLHAQTEQTARLLSDHASSLGLILQDNTHSEVRIQVAQPQENQNAWQHPDQESGQQQQQSHQQQQPRNPPRQETETFLHQLRLGLVQRETDAV